MNNYLILTLQFVVSILTALIIFFEYVRPRLADLPFERAILPLLLLHAFRFTGFSLLAPGQSDPTLSQTALLEMAWGDYLSAVTALIAAYAVWRRSGFAIPLLWLFLFVSFADFINVTRRIIDTDFFNHYIGFTWTFLPWYLPWVIISLFYILYRLYTKRNQPVTDTAR